MGISEYRGGGGFCLVAANLGWADGVTCLRCGLVFGIYGMGD